MMNKHQSSTLLMALAIIAATMLVLTVAVNILFVMPKLRRKERICKEECKKCGSGDCPGRP
jgi:hypothetical protein